MFDQIVLSVERTLYQIAPGRAFVPFLYLIFGVTLFLIWRDVSGYLRRGGSKVKLLFVVGAVGFACGKLAGWW